MRWLRYALILSLLLVSLLLGSGIWWCIGSGLSESYATLLDNQPEQSEAYFSSASVYATENRSIRTLIFECDGTAWADVIEGSLVACNENQLIPGCSFVVTRKIFKEGAKLTYAELQNHDVLLIPGGYLYKIYRNWQAEDIRAWVNNGGGYVGICAGEILAIEGRVKESIFGDFEGLKMATNIQHAITGWVGVRNIRMTSLGTALLGLSGDQAIYQWNGSSFLFGNEQPVGDMSRSDRSIVFAVFSNNTFDPENEDHGIDLWRSDFEGTAAIIGDYYGRGRIILSGPHPEYPKEKGQFKNARLIGAMVKWASKDDTAIPFVIGRENILRQDYLAFTMGAVSCLVTEDSVLSRLKIYIRYGRGKGILGIYSHNEASGKPDQLLTESVFELAGETANYWQEVGVDREIVLKKGSMIWLAWAFENMAILSSESDTIIQKGTFGVSHYLKCDVNWKDLTTALPDPESRTEETCVLETHLPVQFPQPVLEERRIFSCYALGESFDHKDGSRPVTK